MLLCPERHDSSFAASFTNLHNPRFYLTTLKAERDCENISEDEKISNMTGRK